MAKTSLLLYPKPDTPTNIMTDASNNAFGAVLQQFDEVWKPIVFFSKTMKPQETNYSTFDCELLQYTLPSNTLDTLLKDVNFMY